jgi:transcriptional regulator with XRE-family HTH domain
MTSKVIDKLRHREYRTAFVASQINIGIPFQLRALLKAHGKTQEWLAEKADMRQPRISGLLNPGKTRPNIETLRRLAEAFDCGLAVRFVPFSELVSWSENFDPESFSVPSFDEDLSNMEREAETERVFAGKLMSSSPTRDRRTEVAYLNDSKLWRAYNTVQPDQSLTSTCHVSSPGREIPYLESRGLYPVSMLSNHQEAVNG